MSVMEPPPTSNQLQKNAQRPPLSNKDVILQMKPPQKRKVTKVINIGDAIHKRDLMRIRSGSPGLRAGLKKD